MDEIVRAFNWVIEKGWVRDVACRIDIYYIVVQAYYWATSEWTVLQIEEAWRAC